MSKQIISKQGYEKLQNELKEAIEKRRGIADRIQSAKELGDLSENSEYHEAKDSQGFNEGKILGIKQLLKNAEIVDNSQNKGKIGIGSKVKVITRDIEKEFEIVSFNEVNPLKGKISNESPLGTAILNKEVGDIVVINTPKGDIEYKVLSVN